MYLLHRWWTFVDDVRWLSTTSAPLQVKADVVNNCNCMHLMMVISKQKCLLGFVLGFCACEIKHICLPFVGASLQLSSLCITVTVFEQLWYESARHCTFHSLKLPVLSVEAWKYTALVTNSLFSLYLRSNCATLQNRCMSTLHCLQHLLHWLEYVSDTCCKIFCTQWNTSCQRALTKQYLHNVVESWQVFLGKQCA